MGLGVVERVLRPPRQLAARHPSQRCFLRAAAERPQRRQGELAWQGMVGGRQGRVHDDRVMLRVGVRRSRGSLTAAC